MNAPAHNMLTVSNLFILMLLKLTILKLAIAAPRHPNDNKIPNPEAPNLNISLAKTGDNVSIFQTSTATANIVKRRY